ncbi:hypothetical protein SSPO_023520 [Streptomyces antimycoticus]|uniref:Glutaminase n=1 Tax=Streptomyces antimycoticus TaxID=68175 RepID=A0A499UEB9_9ACTN|nr:hypothetical protein SSPO_023520 [Streptomyces antimycoticus]
MSKLAVIFGLLEPLRERVRAGMPVYGTCAGMIMLADKILDGRDDQETIGGIDMIVRRNAFGRQNESFEARVDIEGIDGGPVEGSSSARRGSSPWAAVPKCSRRSTGTPSPSGRATSWRPRSTPS